MEHLDAGQFLDLDRPRHLGPLFEQAQAHLNECAHCRKTLLNLQALRALALESAPELPRSLTRAALIACRQAETSEKLVAETGEDAARELLLRRPRRSAAPAGDWRRRALAWGLAALLAGAGLAWLLKPHAPLEPRAPLPFEFNPSEDPGPGPDQDQPGLLATPAVREPGQSGREADLDAQAQQLLMAQLRKKEKTSPLPTVAAQRPAPDRPQPAASAEPSPAPTPVATPKPEVPSPLPATPQPAYTALGSQPMSDAPLALDSAPPQKQAEATVQASSHEGDQPGVEIRNTRISLAAAEYSLVWVSLPESAGLEIRLYNRAGQAVNLIADGRYGPGHLSFKIEPKDAQGMPLAAGDYYLRVMSRWFSKVELLTVLP